MTGMDTEFEFFTREMDAFSEKLEGLGDPQLVYALLVLSGDEIRDDFRRCAIEVALRRFVPLDALAEGWAMLLRDEPPTNLLTGELIGDLRLVQEEDGADA